MQDTTRQYLVAGLVLLGALVLFGPVAGVAVLVALTRLAEGLGATLAAGDPPTLVASALAVLAGLAVATEAAAVRLGGLEALDRGSDRQRAVRYATLVAVGLATLVTVGSFIFEVTVWSIRTNREEYLVLLAAIAVAVGWVAVRTAMAFHRGWQDRPIDPLA